MLLERQVLHLEDAVVAFELEEMVEQGDEQVLVRLCPEDPFEDEIGLGVVVYAFAFGEPSKQGNPESKAYATRKRQAPRQAEPRGRTRRRSTTVDGGEVGSVTAEKAAPEGDPAEQGPITVAPGCVPTSVEPTHRSGP